MSRNKEKNQSGLHRYYELKIEEAGGIIADPSRRPRKVQLAKTIAEAELWRKTVMSEFLAKLSAVNDPSVSEPELRELNDTLGKLYRERRAWDHHILSLGGANYLKHGDGLGLRVNGVLYYGRAKELPEARAEPKAAGENTKEQLLPLSYYGAYEWAERLPSTVPETLDVIGAMLAKEPARASLPIDYSRRDLEQWLVEKRKKELMKSLLGGSTS